MSKSEIGKWDIPIAYAVSLAMAALLVVPQITDVWSKLHIIVGVAAGIGIFNFMLILGYRSYRNNSQNPAP